MDVVTLGETMVLLTPNTNGLMRYAQQFGRKFGGAESNVCIGLARLGHAASWVSRVGDDEFGRAMVSFIRGEGVDVSQVKTDPSAPTGLYFKEIRRENDVRVYYYRSSSAASCLHKDDISEDYIKQAKFLHVTGITPALSDSCFEAIFYAIEVARQHKVKIVFDPNLRKKLWSEEKARETLLAIASKADIVLPGVEEGEFMFGETQPDVIGKRFLELGAQLVVLKVGAKGSIAYTHEKKTEVPGFKVDQVIDPVGAGDAFAAGFLSGQLDGLSLEGSLQRGNALGAMATMTYGDVEGLPDRQDLKGFTQGISVDVNR
ncbi:sugar kinase [Aneurinibacillus sp. Ricciae_BoGa-3]|uniref:sugar kinase n=1 Tax=Aneurinibacillus sp. Ricciae_BoGa-3 TaxID=3022697 RepID=UPI002341B89F|nr:sugar kinase [Aneurinibacillus sp. Ricciae_BoGa-3]WCK56569.1 sugar kinase [Aneurinibacillus sp. Ricciae_BoGa-3]